MKNLLKIYKVVVILLILFYILVLSTLTVLLGEWAIFGIIKMVYEDIVLGLIGSGFSFYLLVKLSNLATYIVTTKL